MVLKVLVNKSTFLLMLAGIFPGKCTLIPAREIQLEELQKVKCLRFNFFFDSLISVLDLHGLKRSIICCHDFESLVKLFLPGFFNDHD